MKFPTKTVFAAVLAIAGLAATAETSSAMSPARTAPGTSSLVQDVRWGCGPGWHPNPWGRCVPDRRRVQYYGYGQPRRDWGRDHDRGRPERRWDRY